MSITFTRHIGGFVVRFNRALAGVIYLPRPDEQIWRFVNSEGDCFTADTLNDIQRLASDMLLIDCAA
jgi:hypothetical protein